MRCSFGVDDDVDLSASHRAERAGSPRRLNRSSCDRSGGCDGTTFVRSLDRGARTPWYRSWWVPGAGTNGTRRAMKLSGSSSIASTPFLLRRVRDLMLRIATAPARRRSAAGGRARAEDGEGNDTCARGLRDHLGTHAAWLADRTPRSALDPSCLAVLSDERNPHGAATTVRPVLPTGRRRAMRPARSPAAGALAGPRARPSARVAPSRGPARCTTRACVDRPGARCR